MASLGAVQATLEIDVGKALASLNSLGKASEKTSKQLQALGKEKISNDNLRQWLDERERILQQTGQSVFAKASNVLDGTFSRAHSAGLAQLGADAQQTGGILERLADQGGLVNMALGGIASGATLAAGVITAVGAAAVQAAIGVVKLANGLKNAYESTVNFAQTDPSLDLFQRAEAYEAGLRRIDVLARTNDNGLTRGDYDAAAREFSAYANTTRTEALKVLEAITTVGNMGQTFGARIRKGTGIAKEAMKDLVKDAYTFAADYAASFGWNPRDAGDLEKAMKNMRIAFSNWDNFERLASQFALFTEEQQKSILKTKELKGEMAALSEAATYLPENMAGAADATATAMQTGFDTMRKTVRTEWDELADSIGWKELSEKLAGVLTTIGGGLADFIYSLNAAGAGKAIRSMVESVVDALEWCFEKIAKLRSLFADIFEWLGSFDLSGLWDSLMSGVGDAVDAVSDFASGIVDGVSDAFTTLGEWAGTAFDAVYSAVEYAISIFYDLWDIVSESAAWQALSGWVDSAISWVQNLWGVVSDSAAWNALSASINSAISWFANLYNRAVSFINGITSAIRNMFSVAGGIISGIKEAAGRALGIASARANAAAGASAAQSGASEKAAADQKEGGKLDKGLKTWQGGGAGGGRRGGGGRRRGGGGGRGGRGGRSDADKQAERDAKNAERYLKNLQEQVEQVNKMTKMERLHYDIKQGKVVLSGEQLKQAEEYARILDERVKKQRQEKIEIELAAQAMQNRRQIEDAINAVSDVGTSYTMSDRLFSQYQERRKLQQDYQHQLEDLAQKERSAVLGKTAAEAAEEREKYSRLRAMAKEHYETRLDYWQKEVDAVEQASHDIGLNYRKGLLEVADWYSQLGNDVKTATESWARGAADALAQFVRKGKLDFKSLANSILDDIARIAANQFVSAIIGGATAGWSGVGARSSGGSSSNGGGFFSNLFRAVGSFFGFAGGGYTGAGGKYTPAGIVHAGEFVINAASTKKLGLDFLNSLNGYADGGYVAPMPSIVKNGSMGSGENLEVNIYNQTDSQVTALRNNSTGAIDVFVRQAVDAVAANIAQGGAVATAMQSAYALNRGLGVQRRGF